MSLSYEKILALTETTIRTVTNILHTAADSLLLSALEWNEDDTVRLFTEWESTGKLPQINGRTSEDCQKHWADVISVVFTQQELSLKAGICTVTKEYHQMNGGGPTKWTQAESVTLFSNVLAEGKPYHDGISRDVEDMQGHYRDIMFWVFQAKPQFSGGLSDVVKVYYKALEVAASRMPSDL